MFSWCCIACVHGKITVPGPVCQCVAPACNHVSAALHGLQPGYTCSSLSKSKSTSSPTLDVAPAPCRVNVFMYASSPLPCPYRKPRSSSQVTACLASVKIRLAEAQRKSDKRSRKIEEAAQFNIFQTHLHNSVASTDAVMSYARGLKLQSSPLLRLSVSTLGLDGHMERYGWPVYKPLSLQLPQVAKIYAI